MKSQWAILPCALLLSTAAAAEIKFYGKANVSAQRTEQGDESYSDLVSNASRLGISGEEDLGNGLIAVYQVEMEYAVDDGDADDGHIFKARNTYLGIKGSAGTVLAGKIDTPLKKTQAKIDIFNDMAGDIKNVFTKSDNRADNSLHYITPDTLGPFTGRAAYILSEEDGVDDGISLSGSVDLDDLLVGVAVDSDVEAETVDVFRVGAQWHVGMFTLGALWEDQDPGDTAMNDGDGWLVSSLIKLSADWHLGLQYGQSDIVADGGESYGAKLNRILTDNAYAYFFYLNEESDDSAFDDSYLGVGMELKF